MVSSLGPSAESTQEALTKGLASLRLTGIEHVELDRLVIDPAIRHDHQDSVHTRALAALEAQLPPILVHKDSMAVLDGIHRVYAAKRRSQSSIAVRYVDGPRTDAFVLAVRANTTFGKPLSLAERERCARRILASHPHWSDRAIAESCGLSGKTVGALRTRSSEDSPQLNGRRVGRDGKARPVNVDQLRERAASLLQASPEASLRAVAREVGLSPATVKDVRDRQRAVPGPDATGTTVMKGLEAKTTPPRILDDTALHTADDRGTFVAWLEEHLIGANDWRPFVGVVPMSRIYIIADKARDCAAEWSRFADALESRISRRSRGNAEQED